MRSFSFPVDTLPLENYFEKEAKRFCQNGHISCKALDQKCQGWHAGVQRFLWKPHCFGKDIHADASARAGFSLRIWKCLCKQFALHTVVISNCHLWHSTTTEWQENMTNPQSSGWLLLPHFICTFRHFHFESASHSWKIHLWLTAHNICFQHLQHSACNCTNFKKNGAQQIGEHKICHPQLVSTRKLWELSASMAVCGRAPEANIGLLTARHSGNHACWRSSLFLFSPWLRHPYSNIVQNSQRAD